ncbi:hypothetical protein SK128_019637 [Halocaridina rubra]|uniref:Uncharacterized protein n=1 Tax=Halocaridina rubra TaxID=373956 RepID=A0AAN8X3V1_HALRR
MEQVSQFVDNKSLMTSVPACPVSLREDFAIQRQQKNYDNCLNMPWEDWRSQLHITDNRDLLLVFQHSFPGRAERVYSLLMDNKELISNVPV